MKRCKNCNSIIADPDPETTYPVIFCPWPDCQSSELETVSEELPWSDQWPEKHETASRCNCCGNDPGEPHICPVHDNGEWNDWNCTCNCCPDCMAAGKCGAL